MDNLKLDMGKRIASARFEKRMTQAAIAKEVGVTHQCVQKYERKNPLNTESRHVRSNY